MSFRCYIITGLGVYKIQVFIST